MAIIVPTITAENPHVFREQIERVQDFAIRIHIDLMDGVFTPNKSVLPEQVWWPESIEADIHVMFQKPMEIIDRLILLKPRMVIIHAEADVDHRLFAEKLNESGILCGVAVLADTPVSTTSSYLSMMQQILIFSGNLGHQGGSAVDLTLLDKVAQAKSISSQLEIAWDGGVSDQNVRPLLGNGVTVFNVGGFIHSSRDPKKTYQQLRGLA